MENASSLPWGKCVSVYCIFWREKRDGKYKSRLNKTKVNKGKEGGGKQKAKGKGSATQHRGGLRWAARLGNWDGAGYYSRREATCGEQDGDTGATDGLIEREMRQRYSWIKKKHAGSRMTKTCSGERNGRTFGVCFLTLWVPLEYIYVFFDCWQ